ncbi:MAG: CaiB/BaiF CoA-transferase family protein [Pseudomonadota bacterium]
MLSNLRIVEFEGLGPAPFAGMMLADLGAEVIVVHRPQSGPRQSPAPATPPAPSLLDRGKRSIVLDLKSEDDLRVARALIQTADGVIEGLRPGVMERLGLGPDQVMADTPHLVYGRMTGWGQDGPRATTAGHDLAYIGVSGALWYAGAPGTPPLTPATLVGDIGGGAMYLVAGLLAGFLQAAKTGKGTVVDAAIVDGSAHMTALLMAMAAQGHMQEARGQSLLDGPHWCQSYDCADGAWLTVQALEPQFYAIFLERMGLAQDPSFAAQYDHDLWPEQTTRLRAIFAAAPRAHWLTLFEGTDACVAPVLSPWEAEHDPHMAHRGVWQRAGETLQPAPAPRFDGRRGEVNPPPERGADGEAIREELRARGILI